MSNIYLDRDGAEGCVSQLNSQIQALRDAASGINGAMGNLEQVWKGAAADKAQTKYDEEYKTLLTETIPNAVDEFKKFMDDCVKAIFDTDQQLSGG